MCKRELLHYSRNMLIKKRKTVILISIVG